ncbi:MAG TPA: hypothetical protein VK914_07905 [bacterium]|jgi:hypothetical protein|nr:hypothetical protein [bacterium]
MRRRLHFVLALLLCLALTGWLRATAETDQATASGIGNIFANFAQFVTQGVVFGFSGIILIIWIAATWTVLKLYVVIGNYILPVWDVTSGQGATFAGQSLPSFMCVDPGWASNVTTLGSVFFCVAVVLTFVVISGDSLKVALANEDGTRLFAGFGYAFGAMVLYPYLYTGVILLANEMTLLVHNYTTQFPQSATSILSALTQTSVFGTMSPATQQQIGVGTINVVSPTGTLTSGNTLDPQTLWNGLFGVNNNVSAGSIWTTAATYVTSSIEMCVSRLIQIVLCVMGIFELVALLLMKGAQVAGLVVNYYLGILACAMLASPGTRPIFFQWLKSFVELCFWGFIWAILLLATWLIVGVCNSLQGLDGTLVGAFLFPMLLFGTLKKFREVAGIIGGFAVTGAIAAGVGRALESGFKEHQQTGVVAVGKGMEHGGNFGAKAIGGVTDAASRAALVVPGVGSVAAGGIKAVGAAAQVGARATALAGHTLSGLAQPRGRGPADYMRNGGRWGAEGPPASQQASSAPEGPGKRSFSGRQQGNPKGGPKTTGGGPAKAV